MQESLHDSWLSQPLQVVARFGEPDAFECTGPTRNTLPTRSLSGEPFRDEIAPWFVGTELDTAFPLEPLRAFRWREGSLPGPVLRMLEKVPSPK